MPTTIVLLLLTVPAQPDIPPIAYGLFTDTTAAIQTVNLPSFLPAGQMCDLVRGIMTQTGPIPPAVSPWPVQFDCVQVQ